MCVVLLLWLQQSPILKLFKPDDIAGCWLILFNICNTVSKFVSCKRIDAISLTFFVIVCTYEKLTDKKDSDSIKQKQIILSSLAKIQEQVDSIAVW